MTIYRGCKKKKPQPKTEGFQPRRHKCFASSHNQKKANNQFKNKQPELPENHLHRSPTTKDLKKHSYRLLGGAETGGQGGEDAQQVGGWRTG